MYIDCSNLIVAQQIGSNININKYILPNDDQFREIEEFNANLLHEAATYKLWSTNNVENPKKSHLNYKIKDIPAMNLCDFGRSIMKSNDYEMFQKFY